MNTLIPKKIFTAWLSKDGSMPELVKQCIESQKKMCDNYGYEHLLITLENIYSFAPKTKYLEDALNSNYPEGIKYCKATDYLRFCVLYLKGGIFLDSDIECLPNRSFDGMLGDKMFIGLEMADWANGRVVLGTAVLGSEPYHPLLRNIMEEMTEKYSGSDNKNYESSMELLNVLGKNYQDQITLYEPEYLHPKNSFTGQLDNLTDKTITIHHFTKLWTPENNNLNALQQFKYNIEHDINFTFVKRGDGELACMNGESGGNCDGHPYSPELAQALREAFSYLHAHGAHIVEFNDQENYNVLLHRHDNNLKELSDLYKAIAKSSRRKIFVAPSRLSIIQSVLEYDPLFDHILVPEVNAFAFAQQLLEEIPIVENGIYIFCAGMPAKSLIHNLHIANPNATYLDCGSAFDPSISQTRTFQISPEEFNRLYSYPGIDDSGMLDDKGNAGQILQNTEGEMKWVDPPTNNFNLPQDTHPERLWAISNIGEIGEKKIYDLGCGTFKTLPEATGIDIRPDVTDYCCDIHEIEFLGEGVADILISKHSLEHLLDPAKALKEWLRILKPGGKMIIVLPDHEFINTIDPYYSAGQHLHAYTRESFKNFLSLFPELSVSKTETVLKDWSFGCVAYKLPKVTILLPHITGSREEGLQKCFESIKNLNYPTNLIETMLIEGGGTVPEKIASGLDDATGDVIAYAANDMVFEKDALLIAVTDMLELNKGMVSFNEGNILPDRGNEATHFILSRELISKLERGEIFSLDLHHVGVDQFLVRQAELLNEYHHCKDARIIHNHFSNGNEFDETYQKGWSKVNEDRVTLELKLKELSDNGSAIL